MTSITDTANGIIMHTSYCIYNVSTTVYTMYLQYKIEIQNRDRLDFQTENNQKHYLMSSKLS